MTESTESVEDVVAATPTKVAIVDDHKMVAEGVALLLGAEPDIEVVGIAATVADGLRLASDYEPDVVVMDFNLPDGDGVQATAGIMARLPETKVIIFSSLTSESLLAKAVEAGCAGFISKNQSGEEIVAAVRAASRGESIVPTAVLASLLSHLTSPPVSASAGLTAREREILEYLALGRSTDAISTELYLSSHTVRNHVRNILSKLGAHSKLEAVAIAAREGVIKLGNYSEN